MTAIGGTNLRPLGIGEVLDAALKVYRQYFKTLTLAVLIPMLVVALVQNLLFTSFDENSVTTDPEGSVSLPDGFIGAMIGTFLLIAVAQALVMAAAFHAVIRGYLADGCTWQESLKAGMKRVLPLIGLGIVLGIMFFVLMIIVGIFVAIFPPLIIVILPFLIWLAVRLAMSPPAMLAERINPFAAIGRSASLVKGRWWPTFGALVALVLLYIVVQIPVNLLIGAIFADPDSEVLYVIVSTIVTALSYAVTLPIICAVLTILYYDLRVRKEGYDLQLAAGGLSDTPVAVTAGATTGGFTGPESTFGPPSGFTSSPPSEPAAPPAASDSGVDTSGSQPPPGLGGGAGTSGGLAIPTPAAPAPPAPEPEPSGFSTPAPEPEPEPSGFSTPAPAPEPAAPEPEPSGFSAPTTEPEPAEPSGFSTPAPAPEPAATEPEPEPPAPAPPAPAGGISVPVPPPAPDPAPGGFGEPVEPPAPEPADEPGFSWSPTPTEEDEDPAPPPPGEGTPPASQ